MFIVFGRRDDVVCSKIYILPNWLGNIVVVVVETTYYEDKVYLPREVREKLGLVDGDVLHIEVVEKGVAKLSIVRGCQATKRALEKLDNPPNLGAVKGRLSREEIYEDIT
jgi:bifunctional DNA-binding transcriptional regulator/antitoxin component of YhaV-PrlF toxin-antitoxin module